MPRAKRPDWSPMTITMSESSKAFLRVEAKRRGQRPGEIADALIQEARASRRRAEIVSDLESPTRHPEVVAPRTTSQERAFFEAHKEQIAAMGPIFRRRLAKERRIAERGKAWSGQAWKHLGAKERSKIGARYIRAAERDLFRWHCIGAIPASQHQTVKRVLDLHEGERAKEEATHWIDTGECNF